MDDRRPKAWEGLEVLYIVSTSDNARMNSNYHACMFGSLCANTSFGVCSVLDSFYSKIEPKKKSDSIDDANISLDENNRKALQEDLQDIRNCKDRLDVWLRDAPVQSGMDVNDIREVCERVVPFATPTYDDNVGGQNSSERNVGN